MANPVKTASAHQQASSPIADRDRELEDHDFGMTGFRYRDSERLPGDSLVLDSELVIDTDELSVYVAEPESPSSPGASVST